MKKTTLTCAHAIVKYLIAQKILINGKKEPLFPGVFGIFGHGNVACLGQALEESKKELPTYIEDTMNKIWLLLELVMLGQKDDNKFL